MNKYILLWLEAPLQSWGADSKFNVRDTMQFPTKSGILGLILCSMGASGPRPNLLSKLNNTIMHVISYTKNKFKKEIILDDFNVIGSGYNNEDMWQNLMMPKKANNDSDGKRESSKIILKKYLQNACFSVILEVPVELCNTICTSLQNPVYSLFLGRKNCIPTDIVFRGSFDNESDAKIKSEEIAKTKEKEKDFEVFDGDFPDNGDTFSINDVPIKFGENKEYKSRKITIKQI
jgi:CRISPR system Cascade subunit CasD